MGLALSAMSPCTTEESFNEQREEALRDAGQILSVQNINNTLPNPPKISPISQDVDFFTPADHFRRCAGKIASERSKSICIVASVEQDDGGAKG